MFLLIQVELQTTPVSSDVATAAAVKLFSEAAAGQIKYDSLTQKSV